MQTSHSQEFNKIQQDLTTLRELNELFAKYSDESVASLKAIEKQIDDITILAKQSNTQLKQAKEHNKALAYSNIALSVVACSACVPLVGLKSALFLSACLYSYFVFK